MANLVKDFDEYHSQMNEVILTKNNQVIKRLWNLDTCLHCERKGY